MSFDGWPLLMALAVILLPLVLAGILLRPTRARRTESLHPRRTRSTGAGAISNENA